MPVTAPYPLPRTPWKRVLTNQDNAPDHPPGEEEFPDLDEATRLQAENAARDAVDAMLNQGRSDLVAKAVRQALFSRRVLLVFGLVIFVSVVIALTIILATGITR